MKYTLILMVLAAAFVAPVGCEQMSEDAPQASPMHVPVPTPTDRPKGNYPPKLRKHPLPVV